jgi:F0F1-type ATP synthase gamma subunit
MNTLQLMQYMNNSKITNSLSRQAALQAEKDEVDAFIDRQQHLINTMKQIGYTKEDPEIQEILAATAEWLRMR